MRRRQCLPLLGLLAAAIGPAWISSPAVAQQGYTDVRPEPGGKRLWHVAGSDVRTEPSGNRLLFIDGDTVRDAPGGKRILMLDGDSVRADPGGIRLAFFEGSNLRRTPGGALLLFFDGKDVRRAPGAERLLHFEGDTLTKLQRVAILQLWKPDIFQLNAAEMTAAKADQEKAVKEAADAARNKYIGSYQIVNASIPQLGKGTATLTRAGDYLTVTFDFGENGKWSGIGLKREVLGNDEVWIAVCPSGVIGIGTYENTSTGMSGQWIPVAATTRGAEVLGTESLSGPTDFKGLYDITAGSFTMKAGTYTGKFTLTPFKHDNPNVDIDPRMLSWVVSGKSISGIGALVNGVDSAKPVLVAASTTDKLYFVGRIKESVASGIHLDFVANNRTAGFILLSKTQ
jgi:hypothetical protein